MRSYCAVGLSRVGAGGAVMNSRSPASAPDLVPALLGRHSGDGNGPVKGILGLVSGQCYGKGRTGRGQTS